MRDNPDSDFDILHNYLPEFGYKSFWLACLDARPEVIVQALRFSGTAGRVAALSSDVDPSVYALPAVASPRDGRSWALVVSDAFRFLPPNVQALSAGLETSCFLFNTDRVSETHGWFHADRGEIVRAFMVNREQATALWHGPPTEIELAAGIPLASLFDPTDRDQALRADVDEDFVMKLAEMWTVSPFELPGLLPDTFDTVVWRV